MQFIRQLFSRSQASLDVISNNISRLPYIVYSFIAEVDFTIMSIRDHPNHVHRIYIDCCARFISCYLVKIYCHILEFWLS